MKSLNTLRQLRPPECGPAEPPYLNCNRDNLSSLARGSVERLACQADPMHAIRQFFLEGTAPIPGATLIPRADVDRFARRAPADCSSDRCWLRDPRTGPESVYGTFSFRDEGQSRHVQISAHRMSFLVFIGPIPPEKLVLHRCNNKSCWNPSHLYAGDHADNARDLVAWERAEALAGRVTRSAAARALAVRRSAARRAIRCELAA